MGLLAFAPKIDVIWGSTAALTLASSDRLIRSSSNTNPARTNSDPSEVELSHIYVQYNVVKSVEVFGYIDSKCLGIL